MSTCLLHSLGKWKAWCTVRQFIFELSTQETTPTLQPNWEKCLCYLIVLALLGFHLTNLLYTRHRKAQKCSLEIFTRCILVGNAVQFGKILMQPFLAEGATVSFQKLAKNNCALRSSSPSSGKSSNFFSND